MIVNQAKDTASARRRERRHGDTDGFTVLTASSYPERERSGSAGNQAGYLYVVVDVKAWAKGNDRRSKVQAHRETQHSR
jgi:hypothetical protein